MSNVSTGRAHHVYVAVVDDDESARRSMVRLLSAADFQPIAFASAEQFLADWKRPDFDCLVLDIWLEGMGGIDLQRRLAALPGSTPVIFVTAQDAPQLRQEALAAGCAGYFRKIDDGSKIIELIKRLADEHEQQPRKA